MNLLPRKVLTLPRHPGDAVRLLAGMAILLALLALLTALNSFASAGLL